MKKYKAGALLYAVFLSFIISLICGLIILVSYYSNLFADTIAKRDQLVRNVNSSIKIVLTDPSIISVNQQKEIDLYSEGEDKVNLSMSSWGMYEVVTATAIWKNYTVTKKALLGDNKYNEENTALYLADLNNYLSLCGKTEINGNCFLPKLGPKRAYIEGQSFSGKKLINGTVNTSERRLPELNSKLIEINLKRLSGERSSNDSVVYFQELDDIDTIINSFDDKTLCLISKSDLLIEDRVIKGNVIIQSEGIVYIDESAELNDIIIYAAAVITKSDFVGNLQVFATDSIILEEDVQFLYPSFVGLLNSRKKEIPSNIRLGHNSEVCGGVILVDKELDAKKHSRIIIEKDAEVYGQVYSNDLIQHKGKVYGSMYCKKFFLKTPSSVYENHLLNAVIDANKLSEHYIGVSLLKETKEKGLIKWLN